MRVELYTVCLYCRRVQELLVVAASIQILHLQLARDFEVMESEEFSTLLNETVRTMKMLYGLLRKIGGKLPDGGPTSSHRS